MRAYQIGTLAILSLFMVVSFQNCGQSGMTSAKSPDVASRNSPQKELQDIRTLIDNLNHEDLSCAQDSDCEAMPLGWRSCGGPSEYIIASAVSAQHDQLASLAVLHKQKAQAFLAAQNAVGTCEAIMPPEARCVKNVCQR